MFIPLYPCEWNNSIAWAQVGASISEYENSFEVDKNQAALAYKAGADGVYLYNYFDVNHERFDILGSPETCGSVTADGPAQLRKYNGILGKDTKNFVTIK